MNLVGGGKSFPPFFLSAFLVSAIKPAPDCAALPEQADAGASVNVG
jgi:hypothetical protein